jgi:hypothetical protein
VFSLRYGLNNYYFDELRFQRACLTRDPATCKCTCVGTTGAPMFLRRRVRVKMCTPIGVNFLSTRYTDFDLGLSVQFSMNNAEN